MKIQGFVTSILGAFMICTTLSAFAQAAPTTSPATPQVQAPVHTPPPGASNADIILSDKVQDALKAAAPATGEGVNVNVEIKRGVVTLTGTVVDAQAKEKVAQLVRNVPGVKGVINKLETLK